MNIDEFKKIFKFKEKEYPFNTKLVNNKTFLKSPYFLSVYESNFEEFFQKLMKSNIYIVTREENFFDSLEVVNIEVCDNLLTAKTIIDNLEKEDRVTFNIEGHILNEKDK